MQLPTILVAIPFLIFFILLLWKKTPLLWVSLIILILTTGIAVTYWKMFPMFIVGSFAKGFFVALDILFIIFGAMFFLGVMREVGVIENAGRYLESISKDLRVQVILLAWFFENFLEGTAGFGTPSTVVAPLLVGLGINPLNAVVISLLGNSASVVFGAAGAPIKIGFSGIAGSTLPFLAAIINSVGILVPIFILWFLTKGKNNSKKEFWGMAPFALWSGIAFAAPSIISVFLGVEFPSILGSIIGLSLALMTIKFGIFLPKKEDQSKKIAPATLPISKVLLPYALLILLLIVGKFALGSNGIAIPILIKHTFAFFNPGFAFVITAIISALYFKVPAKKFLESLKSSSVSSFSPFLVIVFMSTLAQIMVNSSQNFSGLPSMISSLAISAKNSLLPFLSPFIGGFGSFLTGSATVSNLMFGNFLATAASDLKYSVDTILALAVVGGSAGNMIALSDVLAAETVVGLKHEERTILKKVIIPCLIYISLVGFVGLLILHINI